MEAIVSSYWTGLGPEETDVWFSYDCIISSCKNLVMWAPLFALVFIENPEA